MSVKSIMVLRIGFVKYASLCEIKWLIMEWNMDVFLAGLSRNVHVWINK